SRGGCRSCGPPGVVDGDLVCLDECSSAFGEFVECGADLGAVGGDGWLEAFGGEGFEKFVAGHAVTSNSWACPSTCSAGGVNGLRAALARCLGSVVRQVAR